MRLLTRAHPPSAISGPMSTTTRRSTRSGWPPAGPTRCNGSAGRAGRWSGRCACQDCNSDTIRSMTTHAGHLHARATAGAQSWPLLALTLGLTCAVLLVELVASFWTGSLALLAEAAHLLTDAGGLALALFAIWIAHRPPTPAKTYGYYRAEILAALVNALVLLIVAGGILAEAWQRLRAPVPVLAGPMAVVAALGLAVNLVCASLLHRAAAASLNVRAAYLQVLSHGP